MIALRPNQYFSQENNVSHQKQRTSHSPNIRLLPQPSHKHLGNVNENGKPNNIPTIKQNQLKKGNSVKYPYGNQKKIQVIGDLNSFQIHQSNIISNMYSSPYESVFAKKQQQMIHNQQLNNMNNRFKRKSNKNIPRKSPIPIIKGQQSQQHLLQIIKPIKRNINNNEQNPKEVLSRTFHEEKKSETNRSLSPIPRTNVQNNQLNPTVLKHRFVSKSPVLGRPTFLDRFKKFHIENIGLNCYNSSANSTTMKYLRNNFANINVYKPNVIQNSKEIIVIDALAQDKKDKSIHEENECIINENKDIANEKQQQTLSEINNQIEKTNNNLTKVTKGIHQIYTFTHVGFDGESEKENNQDAFFIESNFGGIANHIYMSVW